MKETYTSLLEARHKTKVAWNEPWEACGPEGNELSAHVTIQATVHDCINMQRMAAKVDGRSTMGDDEEFLVDFMITHGAWVVEETIPRAEAEREIKMWKANHDNQVRIKRAISGRPDLAERAPLVEKLAQELADAHRSLAVIEEIGEVERARWLPAGLDGPWNAILMIAKAITERRKA